MKSAHKIVLVALAASCLFASRLVVAAPDETFSGSNVTSGVACPKDSGEQHAQFLQGRLETLHAALKLKEDQEAAWNQWSGAIKSARPDWKEKHQDIGSLGKLPVPERLEKMVAFAKERLGRLEERLAETKTFYAILSPEQRQTFDKEFNFWPHDGHSGKHCRAGGGPLTRPRIRSR